MTKQKNKNLKDNSNSNVGQGFSVGKYFKKHIGWVIAYLFIGITSTIVDLLITIYSSKMILAVTEYARFVENGDLSQVIRYAIIAGSLFVVGLIYRYVWPWAYQKLSNLISSEMRFDVTQQAFKISSKSYSSHTSGEFMQRISNDPERIVNAFANLVDYISMVAEALVVIIYIAFLNWAIGLLIGVFSILYFIVQKYRRKARIKNHKDLWKASEKHTSLMNEIIRSERDIKSLNLEEPLKVSNKKSLDELKSKTLKLNMSNIKFSLLASILYRLYTIGLVVLGIYLMRLELVVPGVFLVVLQYRGYTNTFSSGLAYLFDSFADIKVALGRIRELYRDDIYEEEKFGIVHRNHLEGRIDFKNVDFTYVEYKPIDPKEIEKKKKYNRRHHIKEEVPTREIKSEKKVFENLNLHIEPNTSVAFVGKSGCGKSTALNLISKLYQVDSGKVTIDGININKLDKQTLRSHITLVNQFPYIFDLTIKENLLLANPKATDEELNQVLKDSALDEFVATLPDGIDSRVGESGIKLSGGQKQRLAIARALLKKSSVIIFDESTSSLDNLSQGIVKESIDRIQGKTTVIIVAHRLSTIKNVDKIFFMDEGKILAEGTFNELYKHNKKFREMYKAEEE